MNNILIYAKTCTWNRCYSHGSQEPEWARGHNLGACPSENDAAVKIHNNTIIYNYKVGCTAKILCHLTFQARALPSKC